MVTIAIHSKTQKEKREPTRPSLTYGTISSSVIVCVIGVPEKESQEINIFEEIMAKAFSHLMKTINAQIQGTQTIPS